MTFYLEFRYSASVVASRVGIHVRLGQPPETLNFTTSLSPFPYEYKGRPEEGMGVTPHSSASRLSGDPEKLKVYHVSTSIPL